MIDIGYSFNQKELGKRIRDERLIVEVVSIDNCLRLAIDAPKEMSIERGENYEKTHDVPECIKRTRMLGGAKRKR